MQVCGREDALSSEPLCVSEEPERRAGGGSGSTHGMELSVWLALRGTVGGELLVVALRLRLRRLWLRLVWLRLWLVRLRLVRLRPQPQPQR